VEYDAWAPLYYRIQGEFHYPFDREVASARRLVELLPPPARVAPLERLARRLEGRDVVIAGLAPGAGPPPVWRLPKDGTAVAVIAADGAAARCLAAGLVPDVITTDLDGPVAAEVTANARGALTVLHAHGDNRPALEEWTPQFAGELAGSWAGPPTAELLDVGGFTDGDRAAFLAVHLRARRVLLWAFDFQRVDATDPTERVTKIRKLAWARELLDHLVAATSVPILTWEPSGEIRPYAGKSEASTR
jgi:2-amino-4-hydroxy-6-hydroxymethyldihydropteridine diphosphokinase